VTAVRDEFLLVNSLLASTLVAGSSLEAQSLGLAIEVFQELAERYPL